MKIRPRRDRCRLPPALLVRRGAMSTAAATSLCRQQRIAALGLALRVPKAPLWPSGDRARQARPWRLTAAAAVAAAAAVPANAAAARGGRVLPLWRRWQVRRHFATHRSATELYNLLGVECSATHTELKDGFLKQVRVHHPDISRDPDAAAKFHQIQRALEVLIDPTTRREYDASTIGVQASWVYEQGLGDSAAEAAPLAALTEAELAKRGDYLDERIRVCSANLSSLQSQSSTTTNAGGVQGSRLETELAGYTEQRRELRDTLQQIAAARIRRGGNRGRKRLSERAQRPETEWYQAPPGVPQDVIDMTRQIIAELRRNPAAPDLEMSFQPSGSAEPGASVAGGGGVKLRGKREEAATGFTSETREM
jgi:curved DNA-binding protein CbpA